MSSFVIVLLKHKYNISRLILMKIYTDWEKSLWNQLKQEFYLVSNCDCPLAILLTCFVERSLHQEIIDLFLFQISSTIYEHVLQDLHDVLNFVADLVIFSRD